MTVDHVVRAVLIRDQHVLLLQRAAHDLFAGYWELPGGGTDGQTHSAALTRELVEETGMRLISVDNIIHQEQFSVPDGHDFIEFTYLIAASGQPVISTEHQAFFWHNLNQPFQHLLSPTAATILQQLRLAVE